MWYTPVENPQEYFEGDAIKQMDNIFAVDPSARHGVLCADAHVGYGHPIGGVVGYKDKVSISGVGFDIACGNKAVKLPIKRCELSDESDPQGREDSKRLGREIQNTISFGIGRPNNEKVEWSLLDVDSFWNTPLLRSLKDKAASQLGTVGGGNHYVNLMTDEEDHIWIACHFGSRGLGHSITSWFLKAIGAKDGMMVDPAVIDVKEQSDLAEQYLHALDLAGHYAYRGRDWVVDRVSQIVQGNLQYVEGVHCHHNYMWKESHFGEELFVVRKGSTPNTPHNRYFVGGSMGGPSYIIEGLDTEENRKMMYSTVHGAGRVLSRRKAKETINYNDVHSELKEKNIFVFGGDSDETPGVYKNLDQVLDIHTNSTRRIHRLDPFVVVMSPRGLDDPYRD